MMLLLFHDSVLALMETHYSEAKLYILCIYLINVNTSMTNYLQKNI